MRFLYRLIIRVIISACILLLILVTVSIVYDYLRRQIPFNPAVWQAAKAPEYTPRFRMVSSAMLRLKDGTVTSRRTAILQFGTPQVGTMTDSYWRYDLGRHGLLLADKYWLHLEFDDNGNLSRYLIAEE